MTTAVASPPSFQPLSRLGWNSNSGGSSGGGGGFNSMSADEVSRMFTPQRKTVQRTNSSCSISSSNSSTSTISASQTPSSSIANGDSGHWPSKKKTRGGFWPASKVEPVSGITTTHPPVSVTTTAPNAGAAMSAAHQPAPMTPSHPNGVRSADPPAQTNEAMAVLTLLPLNGTFERKQINVPFHPGTLKVGRQTNPKTIPTPVNGYFDSKVLSRAHAEVWADRNGKIWIRDVKSSNGTFVNGQRLSAESRDSEPHELRERDTLELGIDIVSEDQKSIVHHKVSAKVEFAGIHGASNSVLDMNFGDIDPSQGVGLLSSPLNQQMPHTRGRPIAPYNRSAASSISAASQTSAIGHQRQMNMWGMPLSVEDLVKMLSNEMRTAKQQAQELDQTSTFLNSLLSTDRKGGKASPSRPTTGSAASRLVNGKSKPHKIDPVSRFSDPPAPPPQQPLPEKPDLARSSPSDAGSVSPFKRSEAGRAASGMGGSPTNQQSSQILTLVEALSTARKELDSQGARVKHLEEMLRQERSAREGAEDRARRLEHSASFKPTGGEQQTPSDSSVSTSTARDGSADFEHSLEHQENEATNRDARVTEGASSTEEDLQSRLDQMIAEMEKVKQNMQKFQQRAETAETDAAKMRTSLAEMIDRLRRENKGAAEAAEREVLSDGITFPPSRTVKEPSFGGPHPTMSNTLLKQQLNLANGHVRAPPSKLPENLERAIATVLKRDGDGQLLSQSAPYASMLGVVLIGVGLMAYLNSWQKIEN